MTATLDIATKSKDHGMALDPTTPLTLLADPETRVPMSEPGVVDAPSLIRGLLGRTEPHLTDVEQRALRACLRLAGEDLSLIGLLDPDFFAAVLAFKTRHGLTPVDPRLDLPTMARIVGEASRRVGSPQHRFYRFRGAWFDAFLAPDLLAEAPGVVALLRELKAGLGVPSRR